MSRMPSRSSVCPRGKLRFSSCLHKLIGPAMYFITRSLRLDNTTCNTFSRTSSLIHPYPPTPDLEQGLHQKAPSYIPHHLLSFIHYHTGNIMHLLERQKRQPTMDRRRPMERKEGRAREESMGGIKGKAKRTNRKLRHTRSNVSLGSPYR
jgi:hypothetical protein